MGKIISLVNQKGGVGKTTTSINLSASLAEYGKKVLLIDLDPQGNATTGVGFNKGDIDASMYDVFNGSKEAKDVILKTSFSNLYLLPSSLQLAGIDIELIDRGRDDPSFQRSFQLREKLLPIKDLYDYIIVDCPPSLGLITTNALTASDSVIIPVQCEFFALEGITQLLNAIMLTQKRLNPDLRLEGVLLTMFDSKTNLGIEVIEEIRSYFKDKVYTTIVPRLIKLAEAPSHGKPIIIYDPKSKGSQAYLNLAKEVIERNGNA
jgi:chromosome partitioning protein